MSFHAAVGEPRLNEDVEDTPFVFGIIEPLTKIEPENSAFPVNGNGFGDGAYEALKAYEAVVAYEVDTGVAMFAIDCERYAKLPSN